MLQKPIKRKLSIIQKSAIMLDLLNGKSINEQFKQLSAPQLQDLRNYLEEQLVFMSATGSPEGLTLAEIKNTLEPIPNYFYKQDCREPLEACFNETCIASNPSCFSNKMKSQLSVILNLLKEYLPGENKEVEFIG